MSDKFVLATHGTAATELVQGKFAHHKVGDSFDRKPGLHIEKWRIVKIFEGGQERKLRALIDLIGFDEAAVLFAFGG